MKNITNGQFELTIDPQYKVREQEKLIRVPGGDIFNQLRRDASTHPTSYYIENIRTGQFTQISENYIEEKDMVDHQQQPIYTTDSFQTQMHVFIKVFQSRFSKIFTFFQGLLAGMVLLFTITLNLSQSVSRDLVRVQDQCVRAVSLFSTFGALHSLIITWNKYQELKIKGTATQIDQCYKCLILCAIQLIFYGISYIVFNFSHEYSVRFSIRGTYYPQLSGITTSYTVLALLGWIFTNVNTYKYDII